MIFGPTDIKLLLPAGPARTVDSSTIQHLLSCSTLSADHRLLFCGDMQTTYSCDNSLRREVNNSLSSEHCECHQGCNIRCGARTSVP